MTGYRVLGLCGGIIAAIVFSACSPRETARVGAVIGRQVGAPIGLVGVVVDETFRTAGDVVKANPRYAKPSAEPTEGNEFRRSSVSPRTSPQPVELVGQDVKIRDPNRGVGESTQWMAYREREVMGVFWTGGASEAERSRALATHSVCELPGRDDGFVVSSGFWKVDDP